MKSVFVVFYKEEPIDWFSTLSEAKFFKKRLEKLFKVKLKIKQKIVGGVK